MLEPLEQAERSQPELRRKRDVKELSEARKLNSNLLRNGNEKRRAEKLKWAEPRVGLGDSDEEENVSSRD